MLQGARTVDPARRRKALDDLIRAYWRPLLRSLAHT